MTVTERLLKYVKIKTPSNENSDTTPTTSSQFELAHILADELKSVGALDAYVDEKCFVYGHIPAAPGYENITRLGFIAHMDTVSNDCEGPITPVVRKNYDGKDLALGTSGRMLTVRDFPHLPSLKGRTLITSDGNTILGVDDKAGIAEILQMAEDLQNNGIPHGPLSIAFTPDEECGTGVESFSLKAFAADVAYTIDGGMEGEVQYQNFNACSASFEIHGVSVHPGSSKNVMINAVLLASQINDMLPSFETPRYTEGYEGFYHLISINGNVSEAISSYIVRDHDETSFENRKQTLRHIEKILNEAWGEGTVKLTIRDSYRNMECIIRDHMDLIENAVHACQNAGVEARITPVRGGTDGCRLSFMGLPCPNLGTGGYGYHGPYEHTTVEGMEASVAVLKELVRIFTGN